MQPLSTARHLAAIHFQFGFESGRCCNESPLLFASVFFPASAMPIVLALTADLDGFSAALMAFEVAFITWLILGKKHLSAFAARKLCHAGSGVIMMMLNCDAILCRLFVYAVALGSLAINWQLLPKFLPNF
jgi:hypothetical protein